MAWLRFAHAPLSLSLVWHRFKGLTQEERLVYSLIEKEGNMGNASCMG
jgi:hypothetical protein